jgi:hypothetical protein
MLAVSLSLPSLMDWRFQGNIQPNAPLDLSVSATFRLWRF